MSGYTFEQLECPECVNAGIVVKAEIGVKINGDTDEETPDFLGTDPRTNGGWWSWDDDSYGICQNCGYEGLMKTFRTGRMVKNG